jgi:hypothetical protein
MNESTPIRLIPWLLMVAIVAIVLSMTELFLLHSADSMIYSLASLDHWTPFFWEQDRVGQVIPLLLSPIRHPLSNLVLQTILTTFAGLTMPFLLAYWYEPRPWAMLGAAVAIAITLVKAPLLFHENYYIVCMYPVGLCFGIGALITFGKGSRLATSIAILLIMLATWTYLVVVVVLLPMSCRDAVRKKSLRPVVLVVVGSIFGYGLMKVGHNRPDFDPPTSNAILPLVQWPASVIAFGRQISDLPDGETWLAITLFSAALGLVAALADRRLTLSAVAIVAAMACEVLFCATRKWIADNQHHSRYIIFSTMSIMALAWMTLMRAFACVIPSLPTNPIAVMIAMLLIGMAAVARYGLPDSSMPRESLENRFGRLASVVEDADPPAFGAKYWDLWTTYFLLRLHAFEKDRPVAVPVGWRSWEYRDDWQRLGRHEAFRILILKDAEGQVTMEAVRRGLEPPTLIVAGTDASIYMTRPQTIHHGQP